MPVSDPRKKPLDAAATASDGGSVLQISAEERALVQLYRSLSTENRRNVMRYAGAVRDIETLFRAGSAADAD